MTAVGAVLALLLVSTPVTVQFDGSLKEALRSVARQGNLNVVVEGELDRAVQVNLSNLPAEEALQTLGRVYRLDVSQEGKVWVVRGRSGPEASAGGKDGDLEHEVEAAREEAEAAREAAQVMRERARELAQAQKERARALKDAAKARAKGVAARERGEVATGPVVVKAGSIVQSATAFGGPVVVESGAVVEGDAVAFGGDVVLKDDTVVEGNAVSFGGQVVREGTAQVQGKEESFGAPSAANALLTPGEAGSNGVTDFLVWFAVLFGFGFLLMMVAPQRLKRVEDSIRAEPLKNAVAGFLALLASLPLTLFLLVTLVGIPVALLMWLVMPLAILAGLPAIANVLGGAIPTGRLRKTQALVLALGVVILLVAISVPVLESVVISFGTCLALGAMVRTRFGRPTKGLPVPDFGAS